MADASFFAGALPTGSSGRRGVRGFTMLEVAVVLVLVSLLTSVAVTSLNAVTGAKLKENVGIVGGAVRDTFGRTALLGRTTRIVFDFAQQAWWIEEAPGVARIKGLRQEPDRDGKGVLDPKDRRLESIDSDTEDEKERTKMQLLGGPAFQPAEGDDGQPHKLPCEPASHEGVCLTSIWVEHLEKAVTDGQVALFFFPGGYTESAHITMSDDKEGESTLTLVVQALTGEVYIELEEPRVVDEEEDDI